jgi:hypothetical protein
MGINNFEDLDVDVRVILKRIFNKYSVRVCIRFIWLRIWSTGRLCGHGTEPSGPIIYREFLYQFGD